MEPSTDVSAVAITVLPSQKDLAGLVENAQNPADSIAYEIEKIVDSKKDEVSSLIFNEQHLLEHLYIPGAIVSFSRTLHYWSCATEYRRLS